MGSSKISNYTPSIQCLEFSVGSKRLPTPIVDASDLREQLGICDAPNDSLLRSSVLAAIGLIEKKTGLAIGPRIVEQCFDEWPGQKSNIPLALFPVWTQAEFESYLEMIEGSGTEAEKCFGECLAELRCSVQIEFESGCETKTLDETTFRLDAKRKPSRLLLRDCCKCWPCHKCNSEIRIKYVAGFKCLGDLESYDPLILPALNMIVCDFYEEKSIGEICKLNSDLFEMLAIS